MSDLKWQFGITDGKWHWRAEYANGQVAARAEKGHATKESCMAEATSMGYKELTEQFLAEAG